MERPDPILNPPITSTPIRTLSWAVNTESSLEGAQQKPASSSPAQDPQGTRLQPGKSSLGRSPTRGRTVKLNQNVSQNPGSNSPGSPPQPEVSKFHNPNAPASAPGKVEQLYSGAMEQLMGQIYQEESQGKPRKSQEQGAGVVATRHQSSMANMYDLVNRTRNSMMLNDKRLNPPPALGHRESILSSFKPEASTPKDGIHMEVGFTAVG